MPKTITSRQCQQARSLLKWNLHDLCSKVNIPLKQVEKFERNLTRLVLHEQKELITTYEKHGIIFCDNLDVILQKDTESMDQGYAGADDTRYNADGTVDDINAANKDKQAEDKMWVHTPDYTGPDRRNKKNQMYFTGNERRKDRQNLVSRVMDKYKK